MNVEFIQQIFEISGLLVLSALGLYAVKLVSSFRTGLLARSWKHVTTGALFLIFAQLPLLGSGVISSNYSTIMIMVGTVMRFVGVVYLVLGLRAQYGVWRLDKKNMISDEARSESTLPSNNSTMCATEDIVRS